MALASCLLLVAPASARHARSHAVHGDQDPVRPATIYMKVTGAQKQIIVAVDKSQFIRFDRSFDQLSLGSKDIADVVAVSRTTFYVLGKKQGTTNLAIQDGNGRALAVLDIVVTFDIDDLKMRIHDLMPDERIKIEPAGGALVLSGQVANAEHLREVSAVAERFAPGMVTNLLTVAGSQQVLLEVKFAEVQRNTLKNLGVDYSGSIHIGSATEVPAIGNGVPLTAFGALATTLTGSGYSLTATLDTLEKRGLVRTLAEPNLVALSGDTASFLAGGEFPIPVAQSVVGTVPTTTIEFKEFGAGLSFTPTVLNDKLINLAIKSEVSAIDPTLSVTTNGIQVPGLKIRRATTAVELDDGQSFAIAGLLQDDYSNGISQIPGIGNIPVLGALFRSTNYQRAQTELVVFITVHLVQPQAKKEIAAPTDTIVPPNPLDLFGAGQTEGDYAADPDAPAASQAPPAVPQNIAPVATNSGGKVP